MENHIDQRAEEAKKREHDHEMARKKEKALILKHDMDKIDSQLKQLIHDLDRYENEHKHIQDDFSRAKTKFDESTHKLQEIAAKKNYLERERLSKYTEISRYPPELWMH